MQLRFDVACNTSGGFMANVSSRVQKHRDALRNNIVDKIMTVKRDKVGAVMGRIDAHTLIEIERFLAIFLGIAK
jgi:mRNA interferase MazF